MGLFGTSKEEKLAIELEQTSSTGDINKIKQWWNSKTKKDQAIIIGLLISITASPLIILWASKLTVVSTAAPSINAAGTLASFTMTKIAAPLWHKILWASLMITATGISATMITAKLNGASAEEYINNIK